MNRNKTGEGGAGSMAATPNLRHGVNKMHQLPIRPLHVNDEKSLTLSTKEKSDVDGRGQVSKRILNHRQARPAHRGSRVEHWDHKKKLAARSSQQWPKLLAHITKRVSDSIDKKVVEASKEHEYLGAPPYTQFPAEGYYVCCNSSCPPTEILGENLVLLNDTRAKFKSFIEYDESLDCIRVRSGSLEDVENAVAQVKAKIQHTIAHAVMPHPSFIVDPPSVAAMRTSITPTFGEGHQIEKQPVIKKIVLSGSRLSADEAVTWEIERRLNIERNEIIFSNHVKDALAKFRVQKCDVKIRVHFGRVQLHAYRKDFKGSTYSFEKFLKMMSESRTRVEMDKRLGDVMFARKILEHFQDASDLFYPVDSQTANLADAKAKHSLVVLARGPSNGKVRIEAEIDTVEDHHIIQGDFPRAKAAAWQIGNTRYYQPETREPCLNFRSIGFERNFDWCLEMSTEVPVSKPSQSFQKLVKNGLSVPIREDKLFFNYPTISLQSLEGLQIDEAWIQSVLQYKLKESHCIMEITTYRLLHKGLPNEENVVACGISLYHKNWDALAVPDGSSMVDFRNWIEEDFFPCGPGSFGGFAGFLSRVQDVQKYLDGL